MYSSVLPKTKMGSNFSADGSTIASVAALPIAPNKAQLVYNAKSSATGKPESGMLPLIRF
jgi:hypothetical protein